MDRQRNPPARRLNRRPRRPVLAVAGLAVLFGGLAVGGWFLWAAGWEGEGSVPVAGLLAAAGAVAAGLLLVELAKR